jgi:hypothetical protein
MESGQEDYVSGRSSAEQENRRRARRYGLGEVAGPPPPQVAKGNKKKSCFPQPFDFTRCFRTCNLVAKIVDEKAKHILQKAPLLARNSTKIGRKTAS